MVSAKVRRVSCKAQGPMTAETEEKKMVVERYMTAKVVTVRPTTSIWEAWRLAQTHQIGHLPVIQGRRLVDSAPGALR